MVTCMHGAESGSGGTRALALLRQRATFRGMRCCGVQLRGGALGQGVGKCNSLTRTGLLGLGKGLGLDSCHFATSRSADSTSGLLHMASPIPAPVRFGLMHAH